MFDAPGITIAPPDGAHAHAQNAPVGPQAVSGAPAEQVAVRLLRFETRPETRLEIFSGAEADWPLWALRAESHFTLFGWGVAIDHALGDGRHIQFEAPMRLENVQCKTVVTNMWHMLLNKCQGRSVHIVRAAGTGNGLEVWRLLKLRYEGRQGGRLLSILRFIMNPG